jgi:membrane protease YdiL (CAAX protease family)
MMTSDSSKSPEQVLELGREAGAVPPSDDYLAAGLRGFGPLGILAILIILLAGNYPFVPLSAVLVLVWVWRSRTPWREIGYVRPRSWIGTLAVGVAFGMAFKILMKAIVMPLLGAPPINQAFHYLAGNRAALPAAIYAMIVVAGFGEETVFRGYLFERLGKLFGSSVWAKTLIVLLTSVWFGLGHYSLQGLAGVQQATIFGLVFGTIFAVRARIGMLMVAHAAFDLTALAMIYWNLESRVAHLIFDF